MPLFPSCRHIESESPVQRAAQKAVGKGDLHRAAATWDAGRGQGRCVQGRNRWKTAMGLQEVGEGPLTTCQTLVTRCPPEANTGWNLLALPLP